MFQEVKAQISSRHLLFLAMFSYASDLPLLLLEHYPVAGPSLPNAAQSLPKSLVGPLRAFPLWTYTWDSVYFWFIWAG